jgi:hypothetical protein
VCGISELCSPRAVGEDPGFHARLPRVGIFFLKLLMLCGRKHENEENATVIGNLHGGMAERRAGGGDTPSVPEA